MKQSFAKNSIETIDSRGGYSIVNNTMHELYFDQVVIASLCLIQNITMRSKYNEFTYYLF